jgi:hypothetical protein
VGICPSPTPLPVDCTTFNFNAYFDCDWVPIPTPTPSIPCDDVEFDFTSVGVTPTPTPSGNFCDGTAVNFSLSGYTPITPTVTLTPSVTLTNTVPANGQVTFNMLEQIFSCVSVKVLVLCDTGVEIYTTSNLTYLGIQITTGTTFSAVINDVQECVTYDRDDVDFSSDSIVSEIYQVFGSCGSCSPPPSQTPTSTPTQTPTSTPTQTPTTTPTPTRTPGGMPPPTSSPTPTNTSTQTPTPTPTPTPNYVYVFQSCNPISSLTTKPTQIIQTLPLSFNIVVNQLFKDGNGVCWEYLGRYETNYPPPPNVIASNQSGNYFIGVGSSIYQNCSSCSLPPPCVRPVGLTQYALMASYFRDGNVTPFIGIPLNNFTLTYSTACTAFGQFSNISNKTNMGYGFFNGESEWVVGSVVYINYNVSNCNKVPKGSYWLQRSNNFDSDYFYNPSINPELPNVQIVTINNLGVITEITDCTPFNVL